MTESWEYEGVLSDGTPLRDVVADMPVDFRYAGRVKWIPATVIKTDDMGMIYMEPVGDSTLKVSRTAGFVRRRRS